jgi:hypothetical protein
MTPYKAKCGAEQFKPELGKDVEEADFDDNVGWCLACGNTQEGAEPDAVRYTCDTCDMPKVYGLAELALRGLVA